MGSPINAAGVGPSQVIDNPINWEGKGSGLRLTHVVDFDFLVITDLSCSLFYFSALFLQSVFNSFSDILFEFSGVGGRNFGISEDLLPTG